MGLGKAEWLHNLKVFVKELVLAQVGFGKFLALIERAGGKSWII